MMNCQTTLLSVMYRLTAVDLKIFEMSFDAALKFLALSDRILFGNPRRPTKRRNAWRKVVADKSVVSSK